MMVLETDSMIRFMLLADLENLSDIYFLNDPFSMSHMHTIKVIN